MRRSYIIAKIGDASHRLDIAHRDWGMVRGPFFREGEQFERALGVYEHFTVAGGIPVGSFVTRQRCLLLEATQAFLRAVQRDGKGSNRRFAPRGAGPWTALARSGLLPACKSS